MTFQFRRGERKNTSVLIGLAGASGSGKTYSALTLAVSLAYPQMTPEQIMETISKEGRCRVVLIDTEGGRGLHYAPKPGAAPDFKNNFPFEYAEIQPPFSPDVYKDAVVSADEAGFVVVIVDSMSHEYEGEGGILEWADKLAAGVPKPGIENPEAWKREHWIERPVQSPGNWNLPKRSHKQMVNRFLQCRCHMIFCLRGEEKMKLVQEEGHNGKMRTKVIPAQDRPLKERWEPICEKRFMYEMTVSMILIPSNPGVPVPIKLEEQHHDCFPEDRQINHQSGWSLAAWASGDAKTPEVSEAKPIENKPQETPQADDGDQEPEAERSQEGSAAPASAVEWVDKYIAVVESCQSLDALTDLQGKQMKNTAKVKSDWPDLWNRITDAHGKTYDRLSVPEQEDIFE